jgi:hypothetical protein
MEAVLSSVMSVSFYRNTLIHIPRDGTPSLYMDCYFIITFANMAKMCVSDNSVTW